MQFKAFLFIATLAPLPAAAFGDLDCITVETCGNGGCGPDVPEAAKFFAVTFNWGEDTVTVTARDTDTVLDWATTTETDDSLASVLEYGDLANAGHRLRIEAQGSDITALYTFSDVSTFTWVATCDVRQAA